MHRQTQQAILRLVTVPCEIVYDNNFVVIF